VVVKADFYSSFNFSEAISQANISIVTGNVYVLLKCIAHNASNSGFIAATGGEADSGTLGYCVFSAIAVDALDNYW